MGTRLKKIGNSFLEESENYGDIWRTCGEYKDLLLELSNLNLEGEDTRRNLLLQQGMALGTTWAVSCLDDFLRTKRFIKGTYDVIRYLRARDSDQTVHLLYAGTGPFAALVLPLISRFSPSELQFTFLEINPISYRNLEKVIRHFKMESYIRHFELVDATQYQIPKGEKIHILLSETMQAGLRKEAQVPICQHLLSQAGAREAVLIPERIELFLGVYCTSSAPIEQYEKVIKWSSYFCLDRHQILDKPNPISGNYPVVNLSIPDFLDETYDKMAIFTEIDIAFGQRLLTGESGLTVPLLIRDLHQNPARKLKVKIGYQLNGEPGELIEFINPSV